MWLGGDLAKPLVLSIPEQLSWGNWYLALAQFWHPQQGEALCIHPYSAVRAKEKVLEGGGRAYGMGGLWLFGCAGQGLKQSCTMSGGKLPSHCMDSMGNGTGPRERGCSGKKGPKKRRGELCSIPRESKPARGVRSSGVLHGAGGWRSRPALWSSLLHQPHLPFAVVFSHLGAICPLLPAGGQRPSSHKQPCQICSPRPAHPRLGKPGPKYHAMSRCSLWVTAHPE